MRREPIQIEPYDAGWPTAFAEQRERIQSALQRWLTMPIEHIGSTSIPGLAAKPIIDMLAVVENYDHVSGAVPALERLRWAMAPEPGDEEQRKLSLCYPEPVHRTHHLHVVERASDGWPQWLLFRDHLRAHPAKAAEYASLKRRLEEADPQDRPTYRAAKAPFIRSVLAGARDQPLSN